MEESSNNRSVITRPALIVDKTRHSQIQALNTEDQVRSAQELSVRLQNPDLSYQSIFLSADQPGISVLECAEEIRQRFPLSPIYLVYEGHEPLTSAELARLGIRGLVHRSKVGDKIQEQREKYSQLVPLLSKAVQNRAKKVATGASISAPLQTLGYRAVLAADMLTADVTLFDVHLLLPSNKRIKIFDANDALDVSRVLKYLSEGVHWVYVKESSLQQCLRSYGLLTETLLQNKNVSDEIKILHVANLGERTFSKLFEEPATLSESTLDEASNLVEMIRALLTTVHGDRKEMIRAFFKHADQLHHALSVTLIAGLLSVEMNMDSPKTLRLLGFASLFHDIGFISLPEYLSAEEPGRLNDTDRLLFETHCEKGVRFLDALGISDTSILQAIAQHHERWNKQGFPNQLGSGQIHVFAELIGISDELVRALKTSSEADKTKVWTRFREEKFNQFSLPVIGAFDAISRNAQKI